MYRYRRWDMDCVRYCPLLKVELKWFSMHEGQGLVIAGVEIG